MGGVFSQSFTRRSVSPWVIMANSAKNGKQILSSEQRQLLRRSWQRLRLNKRCPGDEILDNILKLYPQTRNLFPLSSITTSSDEDKIISIAGRKVFDNDMHGHLYYRNNHGNIFVTVLDFAIKNLDDLENDVAPTLLVLGGRHSYRRLYEKNNNVTSAVTSFTEEFFDYFLPATLQYVAKCDVDQGPPSVDLMQAWAVLLLYMISKLKLGFHTEAFQKKSSNQRYRC